VGNQNKLRSFAGVVLALGGVFYFLTGIIHPNPKGGVSSTFHQAVIDFLQSSRWPISGWMSMVAFILILWGIWMLLDSGLGESSSLIQAGGRLCLISGVFMIVQSAATIAAVDGASAFASGQPVPMVSFFGDLQAVGWPAFTLGLVLIMLGMTLINKIVKILGVIGAAAMGVGGILNEGFHINAAGPLFMGGVLVALWFVWAGIQLSRSANKTPEMN
jgi:hypothetical protein